MTVANATRMALRSILANRMRSILTMFGIVIGVGSVIMLVGAGHATSQAVERKLEALGTNVLTVIPGGFFGDQPVGTQPTVLTDADVEEVAAVGVAGGVASAVPVLNPQVTLQTGARSDTLGEFVGTTPAYQGMHALRVTAGRLLLPDEERRRDRVLVLGAIAAARLFGTENAVGRAVVANGVRFRVVGVLAARGGQFTDDNTAIAPYSATRDNLSGPEAPLASIAVQATSRQDIERAQIAILSALQQAHGARGERADDLAVADQATLLGTTSSVSSILSIVLAGIAGTSLFVGGMGVMNIMLVTVVERTREIGVRKAIGARRRQIVAQFLLESVVLCLLGGAAGVAVGLIAARVGSAATGYAATVGLGAIALSLGVATAVGVVFGFYPANRAARLRPIDALRYE